jgi:hypothetical protein
MSGFCTYDMKTIATNIGLIVFIFFLVACNEKKYSLSDGVHESKVIIDYFNSSPINKFKTWQYFYRSGGGVWTKNTASHEDFRVFYFSNKDYKKLITLSEFKRFFIEYPVNIVFDTTKLTRIVFLQTDECSTQIKFEYFNNGKLSEINKQVKGQIFRINNPFEVFNNLQNIVSKLNVESISYFPLNDCISFSLYKKYTLEYYSDSTISKLNYKQYLANSDLKTFWLRRNWFLKYW